MLKKYLYIGFTSIFIFVSLNTSAQQTRAMWVWNNSSQVFNIIYDEGDARDVLFDFCKQPHGDPDNRITTLFFGCRTAMYANSNYLRGFLSIAADSGLTVEYLDGDPSWATYNQADGYDRINKLITFNNSATRESEKIRGIQFDVEPYLLKESSGYKPPYWDTGRDSVWSSFLNFLETCQAMIDSSKDDLYFGVAIPRWYENQVGIDELKRLQSIVDYVAVMDYNESANVIINDAANEVQHAEELGKYIWIGVETKEVSPETVSFAEEGVAYMEEQLDLVSQVYGTNSVVKGIAIHSYYYYKDLFYGPVSVKKNNNLLPENTMLEQNYPNPFNPSTKIRFAIDKPGIVEIIVFNLLGERVSVILNEYRAAGWHEVTFNGGGLSSGIYFYKLINGDRQLVKEMLYLK